MNLEEALHFLIDLKFNNNRPWFKENETRFQNAKTVFEKLIDEVIPKIRQIDPDIEEMKAKDCIFRVYRDVRFSPNKEPYKSNFGAFIAPGGRKTVKAGYYLHFEPDESFLGGGIYMPQPDVLKTLRKEVYYNTEAFKKILNNKNFKKYFPELYGEKLKSAPAGFPKDFADIDLLKNKDYTVIHKVDNSFWSENKLIDNILDIFKVQYEFNKFLNSALS